MRCEIAWNDSLTKEQIKKWEYLWNEYIPDEGIADTFWNDFIKFLIVLAICFGIYFILF